MSNINFLFSKLKIHVLTWVLIVLSLMTAQFIEIFTLLVIVLIHEFGHGIMASYYGWKIDKLVLLPFGGEMVTSDFGHRPWKEEVLVVLAGPFQHLIIFLCGELLQIFNLVSPHSLFFLYRLNYIVLVTNLLPIWPLDGGKFLFLILTKYTSFVRAHLYTVRISIAFLGALGIITFFSKTWHLNNYLFVGFLLVSLWKEIRQRRYFFIRFLLRKMGSNEKKRRDLRVNYNDSVIKVLKKFKKNYAHTIIVYEGNRLIGILSEEKILNIFFTKNNYDMDIKQIL